MGVKFPAPENSRESGMSQGLHKRLGTKQIDCL